jgi:hypothetical protein
MQHTFGAGPSGSQPGPSVPSGSGQNIYGRQRILWSNAEDDLLESIVAQLSPRAHLAPRWKQVATRMNIEAQEKGIKQRDYKADACKMRHRAIQQKRLQAAAGGVDDGARNKGADGDDEVEDEEDASRDEGDALEDEEDAGQVAENPRERESEFFHPDRFKIGWAANPNDRNLPR